MWYLKIDNGNFVAEKYTIVLIDGKIHRKVLLSITGDYLTVKNQMMEAAFESDMESLDVDYAIRSIASNEDLVASFGIQGKFMFTLNKKDLSPLAPEDNQ
jgi:hypothetical protein